MSELEDLEMYGSALTDADMSHVRALARLRRVTLDAPKVTDSGLVHLLGSRTYSTSLWRNMAITDDGIVGLIKDLDHLRELALENTEVSREGIYRVRLVKPEVCIMEWEGDQLRTWGP